MRSVTDGTPPDAFHYIWRNSLQHSQNAAIASVATPCKPRVELPTFDINAAPAAAKNAFPALARPLRCRPLVKNFFKVVGGPHSEYCSELRDRRRACRPLRARRRCGRGPGLSSPLAAAVAAVAPTELPGGETPPEVIAVQKPTATEASRFLVQATMGPTEAEINRLTGMTYAEWLDEQFAKPQVAASPVHQPGRRRPDLRRPAAQQHQLLGLLVGPGARRRRPAPPARDLRPVRDPGDLVRRRHPAQPDARRGLVLRHARREGLRQLPRAARGRDLSPDDGHLPLAPEEPEGRRRRPAGFPT